MAIARPTTEAPTGGGWRDRIDPVVFAVTGVFAIAFVVWGLVSSAGLSSTATDLQGKVIQGAGWFYVLTASFLVVFVIWIAASKYGQVPLGRDGEQPQFRTLSWIAMMFSAGMGIGLMFFGAAEPLTHFVSPPPGTSEAESTEALRTAMATTMFHWGLHPWAMYALVGLVIAYGTYRAGRSQRLSAAFWPLLGRKSDGWFGRVVDILAIFATLFGSAASLGLGALQIAGGMQYEGWVGKVGEPVLVGIIVVLTIAFIASAVSGVEKGIQWLSNINMGLALLLAVFVFVAGPTLLILNLLPTTLGEYAGQMTEMASRTGASGSDMDEWLGGWTIFYWAWWMSWTPFVGMFIARISRGRTIRQFVTGVLLVPTLVSLVWFAIFGGAAIDAQRTTGGLVGDDGSVNSNTSLFALLEQYPAASVTAVLVMALVAIFFVSGADAASLVMGTLSERGSETPSKVTVVFWGVLTGAVAAIMLVAGGGEAEALNGLQAITIVASLPFTLVVVALCLAIWKDLRHDPIIVHQQLARAAVVDAVATGVEDHDGEFALVVEPADSVPGDHSAALEEVTYVAPLEEEDGEVSEPTPVVDADADGTEGAAGSAGAQPVR
ncbi:BCCT family transporter [Aeromicrobium sp. IC_218]|uniref:BCCT family transporter n=1 Tax=Aeromicrobium sp. IC_218 TaxID=2545468 RepID=UPI00103E5584|nr:BCCT family transporter [Aeromicrobium sp. IC_218]TCI99109.1 BCCT family transporter [Aeromicrobium sp. IC_218]